MKIFRVMAEPLDGDGLPAIAFIVAKDFDEAILLLRKDINFSGYRLPTRCAPFSATMRRTRRASTASI